MQLLHTLYKSLILFPCLVQIQQMLLCLSIIISAAVTLGCIFAPKVYIVVLAPHKNKKPTGTMVMNSRIRSACGSTETFRPNGELKPTTRTVEGGRGPSTVPTSNTTTSGIIIPKQGWGRSEGYTLDHEGITINSFVCVCVCVCVWWCWDESCCYSLGGVKLLLTTV